MTIKVLPPILSKIDVRSKARVNPQARIAENIIEHECRQLGIWLPQLQDYTTMSGYLFPTASLQRLVTLGMYNNFLFFVDDQFDRHAKEGVDIEQEIAMRKVFDNCTRILLSGILPDDNNILYEVCQQLRTRFLNHTTEAWLQRLVQSNLAHLKASTYTIDDILNSNEDIVEGYINLRILDSGMHPTMDSLEFARGIILPNNVIKSRYIQQLRRAVAKIGALSNDIFSYTKEIIGTNSRFNLVCVLEDYGDCRTFQEAVVDAVKIVNDAIDDFYTLTNETPPWNDKQIEADVGEYIEGLRDQVIACWHWQISTNRYRSPNSPFPELRTLI